MKPPVRHLIALCGAWLAHSASALSFGALELQSGGAEPLRARVEILEAAPNEAEGIQVNLASREEYRKARVTYGAWLESASVRIHRADDGRLWAHVETTEPVYDRAVHLLLKGQTPAQQAVSLYLRKLVEDPPTAKPAAASALPAGLTPAMQNERAVLQSLLAWAKAWEGRDLQAYLSSYHPEFTPQQGLSISQWRELRAKRLAANSAIRIVIKKTYIQMEGEDAVVQFTQEYRSNRYSDTAVKTLVMRRTPDGWKILRERT